MSGKYLRSVVGNDTVIKVGNGSITLKNYTDNRINIDGVSELDALPEGVSFKDNILKLAKEFVGNKIDTKDFGLPIKNIDVSDVLKGIEIIGGELVKRINGSKYSDVVRILPQALNSSASPTSSANVVENANALEEDSTVTIEAGGGDDTVYCGDRPNLYVYKAGDGNDVIYSLGATDTLKITGSAYSKTKSGKDVIVTVGEDKIILKNAVGLTTVNIEGTEIFEPKWTREGTTATYGTSENTLFTLSGAKNTLGVKVDTTKEDTSKWTTLKGGNVAYLAGGTGSYYSASGNKVTYNASVAGANNFELSGVKGTPTISGSDVIFTTEGGKITVKNAAKGTAIKVINSKDKVISNYTYTADGIADGKSITLKSNFSGTFNAKSYTKVDGSKVSKAIKIIGSTGNDTLTGGDGNDTLTGGKGKDLFVFTGGKDVVTDYASDDQISVDKNFGTVTYKVSDKNVVLTYGSNSLTIANGLDKKIAFADGTSGTYTKDGIFDSKKTAVTLSAATKTFKAANYSKLVTIDGSAASSTINITGNKLANYIIAGNNGSTLDGGAGNDTLWGGAGNDSLYGGAGNDTFIYKAGEGIDKIFDYQSGDMLQILKTNGKSGSFSKSKFSGGTLTLTISGGGSVVFDGVTKGDTFNINNKTYKISGSKLK